MDPALRAAYEDGYTNRGLGSSTLSTTASQAAAAVKPASTLTAVEEMTKEKAAKESGLLTIFWNYLSIGLSYLTWPLQLVWLYVIWLVTLWFLIPALGMLALLLLALNSPRIARWFRRTGVRMREWYDDLGVNNEILLNLEHGWASFKRAMGDLWLSLRYNEWTDGLLRFMRAVHFLPDTIERWLFRYKYTIVVAIAAALWARHALSHQDAYTPMNELPPALASKAPDWVKYHWQWRTNEGSNSHYQRQPEEPAAIPYDEWARGIGSDDTASLGPIAETTTVSIEPATETHTITLERVTDTETISPEPETHWKTISLRPETHWETIVQDPITETVTYQLDGTTETVTATMTSRITETHSQPEMSTQGTDYWAPPKKKTTIPEGMVWCRQCNQFHCCELPY